MPQEPLLAYVPVLFPPDASGMRTVVDDGLILHGKAVPGLEKYEVTHRKVLVSDELLSDPIFHSMRASSEAIFNEKPAVEVSVSVTRLRAALDHMPADETITLAFIPKRIVGQESINLIDSSGGKAARRKEVATIMTLQQQDVLLLRSYATETSACVAGAVSPAVDVKCVNAKKSRKATRPRTVPANVPDRSPCGAKDREEVRRQFRTALLHKKHNGR